MSDERPAGSRLRRLPWRPLAIAASAAIGGVAAMVALHGSTDDVSRYDVTESGQSAPSARADPLTAELARCRTLPAESDDPACPAAWEASRRRFFGR